MTESGDGTTRSTVDELLAAEARLDRTFAVCVVVLLVRLGWPVYLILTGQAGASWAGYVDVALALVLLLVYVWFGLAVRETARLLGKRGGAYLAWLIIAPCLSLIPIPFLAQAIAASPLILKFLLGAQLRSEIHDRTFAQD